NECPDQRGITVRMRVEWVSESAWNPQAGYVIDILGEVLAQYRKHPTNTYKNARFMVDNVFKTYSQFSDHPDYEQVIMRFRNSMFLKCSNRDKVLARELLSGLPLKYWNEKTFRGIARLFFS
ncbi:glycosyltransferase family 2 protein, partial [Pseudomonas aeruginosa]|nr:glycosyltransferase family 2 protein [Pseudomonas aeruginosa]